MQRFTCRNCGNEVHFESHRCVRCSAMLGYDLESDRMLAFHPVENVWLGASTSDATLFLCANADSAGCNWIVSEPKAQCVSCSRTRTIPDLAVEGNPARWARMEAAKRHLFRSLVRLGLPIPGRQDDPAHGLTFDFLADETAADGSRKPVLTGHDNGVITINIAEADDARRELLRQRMGETYRTILGHFRHEIGHFYWDELVAGTGAQEGFRAAFGDERTDYGDALKAHYENGAPAGWRDSFVSAYATAHPWEDFAETWAHYLHIVDGLETARAYDMTLSATPGPERTNVAVAFDPYARPLASDLVAAWVPLTVAINALNRSVGQPDFYPFVLSEPVSAKLAYIHELVAGAPV